MMFHFTRRDWMRTRNASLASGVEPGGSPAETAFPAIHLMSRRSRGRASLPIGSFRPSAKSNERASLASHAPRIKYRQAARRRADRLGVGNDSCWDNHLRREVTPGAV